MSATNPLAPVNETARSILVCARQLFAERGFDGVSVSDLAAAAGVSKANIFHHYGSKQALYMAVLSDCMEDFGELIEHLQPQRAPIEQRLQHFLQAYGRYLQQQPERAQLVLRELLQNRSEFTEQLAEQTTNAHFRQLHTLLQEGQRAGEIRAGVDMAALVVMMIGAVVFPFQVRSLLQHNPEAGFIDDAEQYSHLLVDILMHGISTKESEK